VFTAAAGRLTAPLDGGRLTDPELDVPWSAAFTSKVCPHLGQRIFATWAPSGMAPLDWHDGQITVLATTPSR
jgi:hypothetical protein